MALKINAKTMGKVKTTEKNAATIFFSSPSARQCQSRYEKPSNEAASLTTGREMTDEPPRSHADIKLQHRLASKLGGSKLSALSPRMEHLNISTSAHAKQE